MAAEETVELLIPVGEVEATLRPTAPRPKSLDGKTIGFLDNRKANADLLLHRLEERLRERYRLAGVVHLEKPSAWAGAPEPVIEELSARCHAVITGIGD